MQDEMWWNPCFTLLKVSLEIIFILILLPPLLNCLFSRFYHSIFQGMQPAQIRETTNPIRINTELQCFSMVLPLSQVKRTIRTNNSRVTRRDYITDENSALPENDNTAIGDIEIRKIMTGNVICVARNDKILKASDQMKSYAISQLPVLDEEKVVGMITERDIIEAYEKYGNKTKFLRVGEVMSSPPPMVRENTNMSAIVAILKQYPAVLVMDDEKIKGIITKSDIVYWELSA